MGLGLAITGAPMGPGAGGAVAPNLPTTALWQQLEVRLGAYADAGKTTLASIGQGIYTLADQSGNGRDAVQATEAQRPIRQVANAIAVARFNGTAHNMSLVNPSALTSAEAFLVLQLDVDPPVGSAQTGIWNMSSQNLSAHYPFTDGTIYDNFGTTVRKTAGNPTPALTNLHCYNIVTASGEWTARINGAQLYTTGTNTVGWCTTPTLGLSYDTRYLDGDVAAFFLYSAKLSNENRAAVQAYIAFFYGITFA